MKNSEAGTMREELPFISIVTPSYTVVGNVDNNMIVL
jgi:hypothetical protein